MLVQKKAQVSLILFLKGVFFVKDSIIKTVPAAEALRKVPQFNPLRYLRQTTSRKTGEPVLKLDLRFKKMWFRLACADGRMVLTPMRITDSMAIFEAQVYLHRDDVGRKKPEMHIRFLPPDDGAEYNIKDDSAKYQLLIK